MSASAAIAALKVLLGTVATVRTGRDALETTSATLPVITLYSINDSRATVQEYDELIFTRQMIVEYKTAATATYDTALDTALAALRAVIQPDGGAAPAGQWLGGNALRLEETGAQFLPPTPNSNEAVLQVTLEFDYYA